MIEYAQTTTEQPRLFTGYRRQYIPPSIQHKQEIKQDPVPDFTTKPVTYLDRANIQKILRRGQPEVSEQPQSQTLKPKPNYKSALSGYKEELKRKEGVSLKAYKDGKYYSIGYGHNSPDIKAGTKITQEEADFLLDEDIKSHSSWLLTQADKLNLTENEFLALFDYGYNAGVGNLQKLLRNKTNKQEIRDALSKNGLVTNTGEALPGLRIRVNERLKMWDNA